MLMYGEHITQKNDKLTKITIKELYHKLTQPDKNFSELFHHIRSLYLIDPQKYKIQKKQLPYIVPSIFDPPYRKKANFKASQYLIIDLDHLNSEQYTPDKIKKILSKDERILLMFTSPSGEGLKIIFKFDKLITNPADYSTFYKIFATEFAQQYNLLTYYDPKTNDPTRACFLSIDLNAYFNPKAIPIKISNYLSEPIQTAKKLQEIEKQIKKLPLKAQKEDLPKDLMQEIKKKLNPNYTPKMQKKIYVPEELNVAEEKIIQAIKSIKKYKIKIEYVKNINYGKQFMFDYNGKKAEINLFYGKHGFKVVKTTKAINHPKFQDAMYQLFLKVLF